MNINFTYYSSYLILLTGIILYMRNNHILSPLLILLGITSIFHHYRFKSWEMNLSQENWDLLRILDWTMVLIITCFVFYYYCNNTILYLFTVIIMVLIGLLNWCNIIPAEYKNLNHCIFHILFILLIIYLIEFNN